MKDYNYNNYNNDYTNIPSDEYSNVIDDNSQPVQEVATDNTDSASDTVEYVASATDNTAEKADNFEQDSSYHFKGSDIPVQDSYSSTSYNANNYNSSYYGSSNTGSNNTQNSYNNSYNSQSYNANSQYGYGGHNHYNTNNGQYNQNTANTNNALKPKKPKKAKKPVSRGSIALVMVLAILLSSLVGFAGGYAAVKLTHTNNGLVVNQTAGNGTTASAVTDANTTGLTTDIVNKTADSVVEITTETVSTGSYFQQYISTGAGSGVIISEDGYILTNNHVIDGANNVKVTLRDGTSYEAKVIGKDATLDIALLKVDAEGLTPATFGDSSEIQVGDYAVVIGNPLGQLGGTVTDGIVSALDRDVIIDGETMSLLQTNAAINPGNSGGGLFNSQGELIGIICAKASSSTTEVEGLGFAIPINDVLDVLNDLKEYGYVKGRVDLGMTLTDVSSTQVYQPGVYVNGVTKGSCADNAGFKSGDLITMVNGEDVDSVAAVNDIIETLNVGDNVKFTVMRGAQKGTLTMTLEEYNPNNDTLTNSGNDQFNDFGSDDYSGWNPFLW